MEESYVEYICFTKEKKTSHLALQKQFSLSNKQDPKEYIFFLY